MEMINKLKEHYNKLMEWSCKTHEGRSTRRFVKSSLHLVIASFIAYAQNDVRYLAVMPFLMGLEKYLMGKYIDNCPTPSQ